MDCCGLYNLFNDSLGYQKCSIFLLFTSLVLEIAICKFSYMLSLL
uniref:Uncharacterized protein n=1 Tax=Rhizophora mucronata TaxID=61149 RepID=A0A2P2QHB1_RHIMU